MLAQDRVLLFYSVRMFRAACTSRRLDILRFMLAHGFDVAQVGVQDVLHGVVDGVADEQSAESAQPLIRFLLDAGVDVNWQVWGRLLVDAVLLGTILTMLHPAA